MQLWPLGKHFAPECIFIKNNKYGTEENYLEGEEKKSTLGLIYK